MLGFIAHSQCVRCYVSKTNVYFRAAQFLDNGKNYSTIASMSRRLKTTFVYKPIQKILLFEENSGATSCLFR